MSIRRQASRKTLAQLKRRDPLSRSTETFKPGSDTLRGEELTRKTTRRFRAAI